MASFYRYRPVGSTQDVVIEYLNEEKDFMIAISDLKNGVTQCVVFGEQEAKDIISFLTEKLERVDES